MEQELFWLGVAFLHCQSQNASPPLFPIQTQAWVTHDMTQRRIQTSLLAKRSPQPGPDAEENTPIYPTTSLFDCYVNKMPASLLKGKKTQEYLM